MPKRWAVGGSVVALLALAAAARTEEPVVRRGAEAFAPVRPTVFKGDLRDLPRAPDWQPGDPIIEIPRRSTRPVVPVPEPAPMRDPLLEVQARAGIWGAIGAPILNFAGGGFSGVQPPDTVGDVGPNHYIQLINAASGTQFRIYNKSGTLVAGPTLLDTLSGSAPCNSGLGDPIVLYDQLAGRWLMSEFSSSGNRLCVYISQTGDPVSGGWFAYAFQATNFPDYPKYGVWPDAYYVGTNENSPAAYALQRSSMLTGAAASRQRFTAPALSGFPFQMLPPADADGATAPPAGAPAIFIRHRDSESHGSPGAADTVQLFEFHVDFATPANSTFTGPFDISVSEFDSNLCGLSSFSCIPQPSGSSPLDPLREVVMNRPQYRNRGTHETIVGSFATDVTGTDRAGVRWFELRKSGASWTLFQEGTHSIDATNRWMSSSAMDGSGNIAVAYNVSSSSVFPGLRYTGRVSSDAPGTMGAEQTLISGAGSNSSIRYGDYAALAVDPADDCTFWFTGEYNPGSQWSTRVGTFRFGPTECGVPPAPDLGITKTDGQTFYVPGQPLTYTIVVTNAGASTAAGAVVADTFPAALTGVSWTCTPSAGSSCAASGSVNINDTVSILASGTLTYTVNATVSAGATGNLVNTATVTFASDPNPGNNSATDTDQQLVVDLGITKTDGQTYYIPGQNITYTIVVTNPSGNTAPGATVVDNLPAALSGVAWTCVPSAGSSCDSSGSGNINDTVTILAGGSLAYTVNATVSPSATGNLINTATVSLPGDPNPGNNSATDTDPVAAALSLDYFTVSPCRVMDTRNLGAPIGGPPLQGGVDRTVTLPPACGIPAEAVALSVNFAVVSPTLSGNIRAYPTGSPSPVVSAINFSAGQTRSNNAIVGLGPAGQLTIRLSQGTADFVIDVNGYFRD